MSTIKRRLKIKVLILLVLSFFSVQANAAGYVGNGAVKFIQNAYGGWIFSTDGADSNPDECAKNIIILNGNHAQYKELYSFLLSSFMAGKKINVYVNGCHSAGYKLLSFVYATP